MSALAAGLATPMALGRQVAAGDTPARASEARARASAGAAASGAGVFDVVRHGAIGDGRTLATAAIQAAIDACHAAGGGLVLLPPGRYLSGALNLRSNIHLHLTAGATLVASTRFDDFPVIDGRWEGVERKTYSSLLTGMDLENVTITGPGALDGQGPPWWQAHQLTWRLRAARKLRREDDNPPEAPLRWPRPRLINLIRCERVTIADLSLNDSPSYFIHLTYCQNVELANASIVALSASNADGIIVDSSKNVRIAGCSIGSGSDCIGIKAGFNQDGRRVGLPSEDIIVTNCHLHQSGGAALAIGSETAADIRNVTISNCTITNCYDGLLVKSARGHGGVVENVRASNLVVSRLRRCALKVSTYFDSVTNTSVSGGTGNRETDRSLRSPVDEGTPTIRDIEIEGVTATGVTDVLVVEGLPERFVRNVRVDQVIARRARRGATVSCAADLAISGFALSGAQAPALQATDVERLELHRLKCMAPSPEHPVVRLTNVAGALIHGCQVEPGAPRFLTSERATDVVLAANQVPPDRAPP